MSLNIGVCFVGTGGNKMVRALRSFRRVEPTLPVHIIFDTSTNSWKRNVQTLDHGWFENQPNVQVRHIENSACVNGAFNKGISWLRDLGYDCACMFHDDIVFSSLPENRGHISEWFERIETDPALQESSGITFAAMEALVHSPVPGHWQRSPAEWDAIDLESESIWQRMCPSGKSPMTFGSPGSDDGITLDGWFVKYFVPAEICPLSRLGPSGYVLSVAIWSQMGGFDERHGIFYDMEYPVYCAMHGLPPVKVIPNVPHLHLHNQTTAYGDPATGLWSHDLQSFIALYGKEPGEVLAEHGYYGFKSFPPGITFPDKNLTYWKYGGKFVAPRV
jgi:hypothetical protein